MPTLIARLRLALTALLLGVALPSAAGTDTGRAWLAGEQATSGGFDGRPGLATSQQATWQAFVTLQALAGLTDERRGAALAHVRDAAGTSTTDLARAALAGASDVREELLRRQNAAGGFGDGSAFRSTAPTR